MRKFYALILSFGIVAVADAQSRPLSKTGYTKSRQESTAFIVRDNFNSFPSGEKQKPAKPSMAVSGTAKSMWLWEQVIGYSTYDNQSNNSNQHRIYVDDNDMVHATWTQSFENTTTWTDRGTGYNSGAGYVWGPEPYERLETVRTGWPGLIRTTGGSELIFNHTGTGNISMMKRTVIGNGDWSMSVVPTALTNDFLWPRAVSDGNVIHLIALSAPTGFDGSPINGVDGNIIYWRSNDAGETWTIQDHIFTQLDPSEFADIESDSYAIDARNGKVSIAIFSEDHDSVLLTSEDGGDTWSSMVFMDFPIPGYIGDQITDIGNDGIIDTITSTDGVGSLLIDQNGVSHVAFGQFAFFDDTAGDSLYTVFLTENLLYWNSSLPTDSLVVIGTVQESPADGDDLFDISVDQSPDYRASLASMPTMGEDGDGNIYIVFSAADEEFLGDQIFRHLFVTKSSDGGDSWDAQIELTPDTDVDEYEYVFPSMYKTVDDRLHIVAQRDNEPGLSVRGDNDSSEENDIIYLAVTTDLDITIGTENVKASASDFLMYPNPSTGLVVITGQDLAGSTLRVFNALGQEVLSTRFSKNFNANDKQTFDFSFLPNGRYTVSIGNGKSRITKELIMQR